MATPPPLKIDDSNRSDHYFLEKKHECFFFYEYASRKGYAFSDGNNLVHNLKKSVLLKAEAQYKHKARAISNCASMLRQAFERSAWVYNDATFSTIPPSKTASHPEYDDRVMQIAQGACHGKGADVRDILRQAQSYEASHTQPDGQRKKPDDLEAIYKTCGSAPKKTVILIDDMLTTGAHFVAAYNTVRRSYRDVRIIGFFIARRTLPNPLEDFDIA